jgi:pimeloyl-ACP methyl ester carboxylesterase
MAIHLIDNAGHWAMYEAAREVNALLRGAFAHANNRGRNG